MEATVVLGQQGRVVLPADVRAALGLKPGETLHLHVEDEWLLLERRAATMLMLEDSADARDDSPLMQLARRQVDSALDRPD